MLIAANTGFSAWIDHRGEIVHQGKRWDEDTIIAEPYLYSQPSLYLTIGDWPAGICLLFCGLLVVIGWRNR
jgi:apolipoprotein N-acyltransferase